MTSSSQLTDWAERLSQLNEDNPTITSIIDEINRTQRPPVPLNANNQSKIQLPTSKLASFASVINNNQNVFINLSKSTRESYIKNQKRQPPLLIIKPHEQFNRSNE